MPSFGSGSLRRRRRQWAHSPVAPSRLGGGERGGGVFLEDVFADARQWVEAAFGADLEADPDTWSWTDITGPGLVLWNPGVNIELGQRDESLDIVPAKFSCVIRNDQPTGGDFTIDNPMGRFWPNVRENTPIRARLDVGNGPSTRAFAYSSSWKPAWLANDDDGTRIAVVQLKAEGISRRLKQGTSAPQSPLWRWNMLSHRYPLTTNTGWPDADQGYHAAPSHFWPLEEGRGAILGANAVDNAYPLRAINEDHMPKFGTDSGLLCTQTMPTFINGASLHVTFPVVRPTGRIETDDAISTKGVRVQHLIHLTESAISALETSLGNIADNFRARTLTVEVASSTLARINVYIDHDATAGLVLFAETKDASDTTIERMGATLGSAFERGIFVTVDVVQIGADIEARFGYLPIMINPEDADPISVILPSYSTMLSLTNSTLVGVTGVVVSGTENLEGGSVGMVGVYGDTADDAMPERFPHALLGRSGDTVAERLYRLGVEQGVRIDVVGEADLVMGAQGTAGFLSLVKECTGVDEGLMLDGLGPGLTYISRTHTYSQAPALTLEAAGGAAGTDVLRPLNIEQDDQRRVNQYTATNPEGSSASFTQPDGDLAPAVVGTYDDSGEHRAALVGTLADIAAWRVAQGTVPGYRYPELEFELAKPVTSVKAQQWLDTLPFSRVDVLGLGTCGADVRLLHLGRVEHWNSRSWHVTGAFAPYDAWSIAVLADELGDAGDYLLWLAEDDGASTLLADVAAGASTFQVATSGAGPVWSTAADDISGLRVLAGGLKIAVTGITGATSPQTFSVDPAAVLKALPAGTPVAVFNPPILGL